MSATRLAAPALFAVIFAAAVALLVVTQGARSQLVIDRIELSNKFDPGAGERAAIRFRLTEDEADATVEVIDAGGAVVDVLQDGEALGDFEMHRFRWDGSGAAPGIYRVRVTLASLDREVVLPEQIVLRRRGRG